MTIAHCLIKKKSPHQGNPKQRNGFRDDNWPDLVIARLIWSTVNWLEKKHTHEQLGTKLTWNNEPKPCNKKYKEKL
jgi:hypothetical protein